MIGTATAPGGVDLVQVEAQNNLVAPCAMRVTRTVEIGPLASYAPPGSCACYFDYVSTAIVVHAVREDVGLPALCARWQPVVPSILLRDT